MTAANPTQPSVSFSPSHTLTHTQINREAAAHSVCARLFLPVSLA